MHSTTVQLHKNAHCNIHCLIYETKKTPSQVQIGLRGWGLGSQRHGTRLESSSPFRLPSGLIWVKRSKGTLA